MGHQKRREKKNKSKKYTVRGIDTQAVQAAAAASATARGTPSAGSAPACLEKLGALDPSLREEGCLDVAHFATIPAHLQLLLQHEGHRLLVPLLRDSNVNVRAAAAAALRNVFSEGSCDDQIAELAVASDRLPCSLTEALMTSLSELFSHHAALVLQLGSSELRDEEAEDAAAVEGSTPPAGQLKIIQQCLQQLLLLGAVIGEACEVVAGIMSSTPALLLCLVEAVLLPSGPSSLLVDVAVAAGDLLRVITDESDSAAQFFATMLPHEKQNELNSLTAASSSDTGASLIPLSPQLLLLRLHVCGVLLNVAPNAANAARVVPFVSAGLDCLPIREVSRAVPFLEERCEAAVELRSAAVEQCQSRLRALQASLDLATQLLAWITSYEAVEGQEGDACDDDDENSFAANPLAPIFLGSAIPARLLALLGNVFAPLDVITGVALRTPSENSKVTSIQHLVLSVEVGLFSLTSNILLLVPVQSLGDCAQVYRAAHSAIRARHDLLSASSTDAAPSAHMRSQLLLQMESLAEICWTVQRKTDDETGGGAAGAVAEDLDVFTRLAWLPGVGRETILCVLGNASLLGRQLHLDPGVLTACGRFVLACLNHSASSPSADDPSLDQIELQAEAANGLIDMFSFDECDTTVYVPLGVHAVLQQLLPRFKRVAGVRGRGKTGAASPRAAAVRDHVRAVVTNLEAFLQYKYQRNREVL